METRLKVLKILLVLLIVVFVIVLIRTIFTQDKTEKTKINNELNSEQMLDIIKNARYALNKSKELIPNSITDESMINFASYYMQLLGEYTVEHTENEVIAKISDVQEVVKHIFDRDLNLSNVSYNVVENRIFVPLYPKSTDVQIYKFRSRTYIEEQDVYIAYIDCLEPYAYQYSEFIQGSMTEYSQDDVIRTLEFKYKIKDGRKILLAYNDVLHI